MYLHCHILWETSLWIFRSKSFTEREREWVCVCVCMPVCVWCVCTPVYPGRKQVLISTVSRTWSLFTGKALGRTTLTVTVQYLQSWDGGLVGLISVCKGSDWLDGWQTNTLPNINTPACVSACRRGRVYMSYLLFHCSNRHVSNLPQTPKVPTKPHIITFLKSSCNNHSPHLWYEFKKFWITVIQATAVACVVYMGAAGRMEGCFTCADDALKVI